MAEIVVNTTNQQVIVEPSNTILEIPNEAIEIVEVGSQIVQYIDPYSELVFALNGNGSAIQAAAKADIRIPYNCTITGWDLVADQVGSIELDIWKDSYNNYPPTVADSITGGAYPSLSSALKNTDDNLADWSVNLAIGDYLRLNVNSSSTVTRATLILKLTKTQG